MDTSQWPQETVKSNTVTAAAVAAPKISERKIRRKREEKRLNCPRCNSNNTKFCYYNNYSLTQPRHICKACRRYWTEGGSLRNVPVGGGGGGGGRKNKRSVTMTSSSSYMQNPNFLGFQRTVGDISGSDLANEVLGLEEFGGRGLGLGLGFQVGFGGSTEEVDEGRRGGDAGGFWSGVMGNGGNW